METNRAALIYAQAAASDGRFLRLHAAARRVFGQEADRRYAEAVLQYGKPQTPDYRLEDLLPAAADDLTPLLKVVRTALKREAAYIAALYDFEVAPASELTAGIWTRDGQRQGMEARRSALSVDTALQAAQTLTQSLWGIPTWPQEVNVLAASDELFAWEMPLPFLQDIWQAIELAQEEWLTLWALWLRAYVHALTPACHFVADETTSPQRFIITKVK